MGGAGIIRGDGYCAHAIRGSRYMKYEISELAVFDARLYIRVRRIDEPA
jgi:hypothetical protein